MSNELPSNSLVRETLRVLVRRRYVFCGSFILLAAVAVMLVLARPDSFVSEAKLFVRIGRESIALDPTATTGQTLSLNTSRETEINSTLELFRSRAVAEQVVDAIGPERILATQGGIAWIDRAKQWTRGVKKAIKQQLTATMGKAAVGGADAQTILREEAITQLVDNTHITAPKMSTVIVVTSKAQSPQLAREIVAKFVQVCVDGHVRLNHTVGSHDFFREQSELLRTQWVEKRQQLIQLKNERGIGTIESQFAMVEQQKAEVELARLRNSTELAAAQAKLGAGEAAISQVESTVLLQRVAGVEDLGTDGMRQQLYELEMQKGELSAKYHENHPLVTAVSRQLEEARAILAAEDETQTQSTYGMNPTWQTLYTEHMQAEALLASLNATGRVLDEQHETIVAQIRDLNTDALQYETLQLEVEQLAAGYAAYTESLELSRIDNALEQQRISNVNVAQAASFVVKPTGPSRSMMAGLGLLIALVGGAGMALFVEYLREPVPLPQPEQRVHADTPRHRDTISPAMSHDDESSVPGSETEEESELESELETAGADAVSPRSPR